MAVRKPIKVRQFRDGKLINEYKSIGCAERSMGMPKGTLSSYFSRKGSFCYGFKWVKAMGIKMSTSMVDVDAYIAAGLERAHNLTVRAFMLLGEKCIIEARDRSSEASWFDQSGNLRSSIGYVVVFNGKIVHTSAFSQVKNGSDGKQEGEALAKRLAQNHRKGYALIVVAGMNYAAYVEAMENKVVLASAELFAKKELPSMIERLKKQIAR